MSWQRLIIPILFFFTLMRMASAQNTASESWIPLGARPVALGGAFAAPPPDWVDLHWNPASIASYQHYHVLSDYVELYRMGIHYYGLGYIAPANNRAWNLGLGWTRLALDDAHFNYAEDEFALGIAYRLLRRVKIGANLHYHRINFGESDRIGNGIGLHLGALVLASSDLTFGFVVRNTGDTSIRVNEDISYRLFETRSMLGLRYRFSPNWQLFTTWAPIDVRLGLEYKYNQSLAFRIGALKDTEYWTEYWNEYQLSAGLGLAYRQFQLDYSYQHHPYLPDNHYLSLSLTIRKKKSPIVADQVQMRDLFPVLYKQYSITPVGFVRVHNTSLENCEVGVVVSLPPFTSDNGDVSQWHALQPGERKEIPVYLNANENILTLEEDRPVSLNIRIFGKCEDEYVSSTNGETVLYQRNAITWEDPRKVAAFIYPSSEVVDKFVRETLRNYQNATPPFLPIELAHAIQMYDELGELNFQYKPDPNHPFETTVLQRNEIDTVQDPTATLARRTGDCDDLVVLFAACLENIGLNTAIVDFPGHLFLMFQPPEPLSAEIAALYGVEWNESIWYPIEMTTIGVPWTEANLIGRQQFEYWKLHNDFNVFTLASAWHEYPPVLFPPSVQVLTVTARGKLLEQDYSVIQVQLKELIRRRVEPAPETDTVSVLGMEYAQAGLYPEAVEVFQTALAQNSDSPNYLNNLGNVLALMGNYEQALYYFERALAQVPQDAAIHLNKSLMLYQLNRWEDALNAYETARELDPEIPENPTLEALRE